MIAGSSQTSTSAEQRQHVARVNQHLCRQRQETFASQLGEVSRLIREASLPKPTTLLDLDQNSICEIAEHCASINDRLNLLCVCHELRQLLSAMQIDMTPLPEAAKAGLFFGVPRPLSVARWLQAQISQQAFLLRGVRLQLKFDSEYGGGLHHPPWTEAEDGSLQPMLPTASEEEPIIMPSPPPMPHRGPAEVGCRMQTLAELRALREALRLCGDYGLRELILQAGATHTVADHTRKELRSGWSPRRLTVWLPDRRHGAVRPHAAVSLRYLTGGGARDCGQLRALTLQGLVLTDLDALATACPQLRALVLDGCALMRRPPEPSSLAAAAEDAETEAEAVNGEWDAAATAALQSVGRVLERQDFPPANLAGLDALADRLEALTLRYLRHPVQLLAESQLAPSAGRCLGLRSLAIEGHTVDSLESIGALVRLTHLELDLSARVHEGVLGCVVGMAPLARLTELAHLTLRDAGGLTSSTPLATLAPLGACTCLESLELINIHTLDEETSQTTGQGAGQGAGSHDQDQSVMGVEEMYARGCWPNLTRLILCATPLRRPWRLADAPNASALTYLDVSGVDRLPRMVRPGLLELPARMPKLRTLVAEHVLPHRWTACFDEARDNRFFQYTRHLSSGSPGMPRALCNSLYPLSSCLPRLLAKLPSPHPPVAFLPFPPSLQSSRRPYHSTIACPRGAS